MEMDRIHQRHCEFGGVLLAQGRGNWGAYSTAYTYSVNVNFITKCK
ncbi:hypothetical protein VIC_001254 [Vibrio coralliilyticus ATCC BAA-450]|nr:hypothetical protein VIC_001254 [Vibrio coralliilyticus ATCC BAA-450]